MSLLTQILIAWALVHASAALTHGFVALRRGRNDAHLAFAGVSLVLAVYLCGSAKVAGGSTIDAVLAGDRLRWFAGALLVPAFIVLVRGLTRRRRRVRDALGFAWGAVAAFGSATGLVTAPGHAMSAGALLRPTLFGDVCAALGVAIAVAYSVDLARFARVGRRGRAILAGATLLACIGYAADFYARVAEQAAWYLMGHFTVLASICFTYVLMSRFVAEGEELLARTSELRDSCAELNRMQDTLVRREQLATVGELAAIVAHDVRNPLAVLKNATAGLRRGTLEPQHRAELLQILDDEGDRLNRLIRDLLEYAKPIEPQLEPLVLAPVITHAVELSVSGSDHADVVKVETDLQAAGTRIAGDRELLTRAVINLVDNAMEAMPSGGRLGIKSQRGLDHGRPVVRISISDTGEGMDTLVRARASDPFFTTRSTGTGLGLAIVKRVAHKHGGSLAIERNADDGTTVVMTFPTVEEPR